MEITVDIVVCAELKYYKPIIKLFVGTGMTKNIYTMVERSQCFFLLTGSDFIRGLAGWELCLTASFCQKDAKDTQTRDRESQAGVARFEGKRAK